MAVGESTTGTIEVNSDTDWFAVTLTAGTTYLLNLQGSANGAGTLNDPMLYLYDSSGRYLDLTSSGGPNGDPQLGFTPTSTGRYYIAAGESGDNATGTYTV
ncbi:PPC domain-containing protein [Rhodoferax sp. 4810]|nr:PPC domain-containing protein [Rhodoferax jenense]